MRRLTLVEHQTSAGVRLTHAERERLQAIVPALAVAPSRGAGGGWYDLTPGSWIGVGATESLCVEVRPKLPLEHVLFLASYAADPLAGRERAVAPPAPLAPAPSLDEAIVPIFAAAVRRAFRGGVLTGYRTEEASLPVLRGRLRFETQLREHFGCFPPAAVRFQNLTEDVVENRLLKAALDRLRRLPVRSRSTAALLRSLAAPLTSVSTLDCGPGGVPPVTYTPRNVRYRPAVEIARLIVQATSLDLAAGHVPAASFFLDMNRVFEDFVVVALREALGLSARAFPQGSAGLSLDAGGALSLRPDLSWWEGRRCVFAGDVKYKRSAGGEHADLYQLLAYATAAGLPGGLLVYAAGEAGPGAYQVANAGAGGKTLHVVTLDLAGSPAEILAQITTLAQRIRRLASAARSAVPLGA